MSSASTQIDYGLLRRLTNEPLVSQSDWQCLYEDEQNRQTRPDFVEYTKTLLNSENEVVAQRAAVPIQLRQRILKTVESLIAYSSEGLTDPQKEVMNWALRSIKVVHDAVDTPRSSCVFSGRRKDLVKAHFKVLNVDTACITESPRFYYQSEYGVVVRCWTLLGKIEHYIHRIVSQKIHARGEEDKYNAKEDESRLIAALNCAADFLFMFFRYQKSQKRKRCCHKIIQKTK
jgi:hypothetical protein